MVVARQNWATPERNEFQREGAAVPSREGSVLGHCQVLRQAGAVIDVRTAHPDDDEALVAIDAATWTPAVSPAPMPEAGTAYFGERAKPEDVLVALVDGVVAGYVQLKQTSPVPSHEHVLLINGLAVHPDHQRSGIGRRLIEAAVEEASHRGVRKLSLRVLAPNTTARRLYEALGFVIEGILREEFLLDGTYVDDVFMARQL